MFRASYTYYLKVEKHLLIYFILIKKLKCFINDFLKSHDLSFYAFIYQTSLVEHIVFFWNDLWLFIGNPF